jgi:DNA-binding response OmpR family regulator
MTPFELRQMVRLRRENDALRECNARLVAALGDTLPIPLAWRLTPSERSIFRVLVTREVATKDAMMASLYSHRPCDEPGARILQVLVCKLRKKLPAGTTITNVWGIGYTLDPETRRAFRTHRREAA